MGFLLIEHSGSIPAAKPEQKRPMAKRTEGEPGTGSGGAGSRAQPGNSAGPDPGCASRRGVIQGQVCIEAGWSWMP
ncbi:MAG: hypothetical protein IPF48_14200 [Sphingomonadales bacterium]|uniref:Uncharacterized protein n=1 Tax=Novosphingobium sediminis TaxID=707214 RepID=A0A512AQ14_9SPHN|nr:hypothetical protein [Sphingomonadales bacterium]GEO01791.1 hypothetical protein NSE01_36230 [Novosphingobium sediminis]